jgi:hypothetical protein
MRFRREVDSIEAVVIFRKNGIEDDNRNTTALQVTLYLSDVITSPFRGYEESPIVSSRLKDHEVRLVVDSGIEPREHASRCVERSACIHYPHVVTRGSEHLL